MSILKGGAIKPNFDPEHITEKDPRPYISLSRDKRFDMFGSLPITFVIDQGRLATSHKIVPYDSFAGYDEFSQRSSGTSEAEERVYKPIPISYVKYVILRTTDWIDSQAVLDAAKSANIPVVDTKGNRLDENFADSNKINEVLDKPYSYTMSKRIKDTSAIANTPNGPLVIKFDYVGENNYTIDFSVNQSMEKTGTGDQFRIFATVKAATLDWIKSLDLSQVDTIGFSAEKGEGKGESRAKLYANFAKQLAKKLGWSFFHEDGRTTDFFDLINPNPPKNENTTENFADGKVKGKSRPGRFKKAGVSCKGSVSSLRKKAKNSSGERQKGYHFCANMKSGRKKGK